LSTTRVTLTLDRQVVEETRALGGENMSRLVNSLLSERLDASRRMRLEEELRLGYLAEAETDMQIMHEYRHVDRESDQADNV
jgi:post-segregation antitoxin (ccd killing protein)